MRRISHAKKWQKIGHSDTLTDALFGLAMLRDNGRMRFTEITFRAPLAGIPSAPTELIEESANSAAEPRTSYGSQCELHRAKRVFKTSEWRMTQ